jgi:hypothetical protein
MLAWQLGFPVFAWKRSCRPLLLGGAAVAFVVNVFVLHWPLMGPIVAIACLSYLTPAEWRRLVSGLNWAWTRGEKLPTTNVPKTSRGRAMEGVRR